MVIITNDVCPPTLPHLEVKLCSPEDLSIELPQDGKSVGELMIRGPTATGRYFNSPDSACNFHRGWLATGDVCKITREGRVLLVDRSKDLVKSGGEWISSKDVENLLAGVDGVLQACVVAQHHPKWDERPVAVVIAKQGHTQQEILERIALSCEKELAKYEIPDEVLFWDAIPMTGTGKMDKKNIRATLEAQNYKLPSLRNNKSKL